MEGSWKLILGTKEKVFFKGMQTAKVSVDDRYDTVFYILTSDNNQLILNSYVKTDDTTGLEIDGVYYKANNYMTTKYPSNYAHAIKIYLKERELKPTKDIKNMQDVLDLYEELHKKGKELYNL